MLNMHQKNKLLKGRKGTKHHAAKLKNKDIVKIRSYGDNVTLKEIAKHFNISESHVHRIKKNIAWSHLNEPGK